MRRESDPTQLRALQIRNGKPWRMLSRRLRALHPLCCDPLGEHRGRIEPTHSIHHVQPLHKHPELAYDIGNLAPVCRVCHDRVEARMRSGEDMGKYFLGKTCLDTGGGSNVY